MNKHGVQIEGNWNGEMSNHACNDNVINVFRVTPLSQVMFHPVNVTNVEETPLGPTKDTGVVLNGIALGRGVHYTEQLVQMVH